MVWDPWNIIFWNYNWYLSNYCRQDSPCEHSLDSLHQLQFKDDLIKDDASKDDVIKDDENKDDLKHSDKVQEALHAGHEGPYKSVLV